MAVIRKSVSTLAGIVTLVILGVVLLSPQLIEADGGSNPPFPGRDSTWVNCDTIHADTSGIPD
jgi:hypothetical protein